MGNLFKLENFRLALPRLRRFIVNTMSRRIEIGPR